MKYSQAALVACIATGALSLSGVSARPHFHPHFSAPSERDGEINVSPQMARTLTPHHIYLVRQYLDEMDTRALSDIVRGVRKTRKESKASRLQAKADKAAAKAATAAGGDASGGISERDLLFTDDLSTREYNVEDELTARLFDNFRANYRKARAERLQKQADKAALKAGGAAGAGADPTTRALGDFEDDLLARDLGSIEDELAARMFEKFKQNYRQAKADRLRKKADKAALKAGGGGASADASGDVARRNEEAAIEARSFMDMVRGVKKQRKAGKAERLQKEADLAAGKAASAASDVGTRSLWDFGSMEELD